MVFLLPDTNFDVIAPKFLALLPAKAVTHSSTVNYFGVFVETVTVEETTVMKL
jgi:hypothetical protein